MSIASIVAWLWMAAQQPQFARFPSEQPKVGQVMVACGAVHKDSNGDKVQDYCWVYPPKPAAEHVIEIRTKHEDKKDAIGEEKPAPAPCNVSAGTTLVCVTSPITHWHCADADHQLEGGFDEVSFIDPDHPNNPYCIRVTREIWIDGQKWGVLKESE